MKNTWKYVCIGVLLLLGMLSVVSANPLYVTYTERYNVTANVSGDGTTEYTLHNLTGYVIINNTASNDTLSDVWVAINVSNNITEPYVAYNGTPKKVFIKYTAPSYTGLPPGLTYIHIPMLPNKSYVEVAIPLNKSIAGIPIIVNETYSVTKVPANKLANWKVSFNISRNTSALPNLDTPVLVKVTKYLSNDPNHYGSSYWTFLNISDPNASVGSTQLWNGPYFSGGNDALNWTDVILNNTQNGSLSFRVYANSSYSDGEAIEAEYGFAVIFFKFNGTKSGTKVEGVYAIGDGEPSVCKKGPDKDETTGEYILWYENASFKNTGSEYYYNLTKVNIWAVDGSNPSILDPYNQTLLIQGSNRTLYPNTLLAPGDIWTSDTYNFTFPGVPVIWANYTFNIVDSNITLLNTTVNEYSDEYGSSYIVIEKIYIIGSYLIKVTKHIHANPDGSYTIYIVVENIGGEKSPKVYVYDLVPNNFSIVGNITVERPYMENDSGSHTLTNNPRYHLSLYWALNPLNGGADGDGDYNDTTELDNNQTVLITYTVNGTGTFIPSDLFIVGIDPTYSLLPTTSPKMVMIGGSSGNNYEVLLALLTGLVGTILVVRKVRR